MNLGVFSSIGAENDGKHCEIFFSTVFVWKWHCKKNISKLLDDNIVFSEQRSQSKRH